MPLPVTDLEQLWARPLDADGQSRESPAVPRRVDGRCHTDVGHSQEPTQLRTSPLEGVREQRDSPAILGPVDERRAGPDPFKLGLVAAAFVLFIFLVWCVKAKPPTQGGERDATVRPATHARELVPTTAAPPAEATALEVPAVAHAEQGFAQTPSRGPLAGEESAREPPRPEAGPTHAELVPTTAAPPAEATALEVPAVAHAEQGFAQTPSRGSLAGEESAREPPRSEAGPTHPAPPEPGAPFTCSCSMTTAASPNVRATCQASCLLS
jgi:hypothetical protein